MAKQKLRSKTIDYTDTLRLRLSGDVWHCEQWDGKRWKVRGYHGTVDRAVRDLANCVIDDSDAVSLRALADEFEQVFQNFRRLVKHGL